MQKQYDLIIIGAGPGGYVAAVRAAQSGMSVALIERDQVGGTCLNRGCIPTKTLMHTSHLYGEITKCEELGISVNQATYDIEKIYARKDDVVKQLRSGIEFLLNSNKIDLVRGTGSIVDKNTVAVSTDDEEMELKAKNILIAAGSVPSKPPIEGIDLPGVITSNELLDQSGTDYKNLIVIGGGVVGVEFATIFNSLGGKVTIIEAMDRLLPTMDREISQNLSMILKKRGVAVFAPASVEKLEQGEHGLLCHFTQKGKSQILETEAVLVSVGRRAYIEGLFREGMSAESGRGLVVDEHFATSIPGVYAIGDVIQGGIQLAHMASAQAGNVVAHICGKSPEVDLNTVPSCIYTDPEIASVGMDAAMAKEKGIAVKTGKFSMAGNGKSIIENQERGFIKLIFHAETEVILGAQLMCARATDLISELSTAIVNKLTISQLSAVIRPHPTFTEGVTEAVEDAKGIAVHIAPKRKHPFGQS